MYFQFYVLAILCSIVGSLLYIMYWVMVCQIFIAVGEIYMSLGNLVNFFFFFLKMLILRNKFRFQF